MPTKTFEPDFLFSRLTDVHFGGSGYLVLSGYEGLPFQALSALPKGAEVTQFFQVASGPGGSGNVFMAGYAVYFPDKLTGEFQVGGTPSAIGDVNVAVYTKPPFDKPGQKWFYDYQGADQEGRFQFGSPPSKPGPVGPDASVRVPGQSGTFFIKVSADVAQKGHGTVTAQD